MRGSLSRNTPADNALWGKRPTYHEMSPVLYSTAMGELGGRRVYGIAELAGMLQRELETAFPDIWVEGEVSQLKRAASGHLYMTLREGKAALRVVMWASHAGRLRFAPEAGMRILARGRLSFYPEGGDLQLYATVLEPSGAGALMMALEQAKRRLIAEGLTEPSRRRPIPPFPARVGVVTSLEGAALKDILSVLRRRGAGFDLVVAPSAVQGSGAPASLADALRRLQAVPGVEVILLTRGGGSLEDLWGFNDEALAREVAASRVPVISAVGHEVDTVLTDLTADLRAATPSVAAELLTGAREAALKAAAEGERRLKGFIFSDLKFMEERLRRSSAKRLGALLARRVDLAGERADLFERRAADWARTRLETLSTRMARAGATLSPNALRGWIEARKKRLDAAGVGLDRGGRRRLASAGESAGALARLLDSLSPLAVLGRGYAAGFVNGRLLVSPAQAPAGARVALALKEGTLRCTSEGEGSQDLPPALVPSQEG